MVDQAFRLNNQPFQSLYYPEIALQHYAKLFSVLYPPLCQYLTEFLNGHVDPN